MNTVLLKINPSNPDLHKINNAARFIRAGGLVAFPTETVYGLGANAFNSKAIKKIFKVKGRPQKNPLIVHIADKKDIYSLVKEPPKMLDEIMKNFWPGPLTIILKKSNKVSNGVTAGLDTVAIRMPSHKIALALIKKAGVPIAAPSANVSGKPSTTSSKHVVADLSGQIDCIIDGGSANIGLESTVIDLTTTPITLLRPGQITLEQLKKFFGKVNVHKVVVAKEKMNPGELIKAPGMRYKHYAPNAEVILVEGNKTEKNKKIKALINECKIKKKLFRIISYVEYKTKDCFVCKNPKHMAKNLFTKFREFDDDGIDIIIVEGTKDKEIGLALMNRLRKAASKCV